MPPALKLDVPGTVNTPVCTIAPPVLTDKLLVEPNVVVGKEIPALASVIVKLEDAAPVIAPPNVMVPEPAPPIDEVVATLSGALTVMLLPDSVNAPLPEPVPFKVIVLVLPSVALLKLRFNIAPEVIPVLADVPRPPALVNVNVPLLTLVAPV